MTINRYRPSNGSEGAWFMGQFCAHCKREAGGKYCTILGRTMAHLRDEKEYPTEWRYDEDKNPTCTAFSDKSIINPRHTKQKTTEGLPLFVEESFKR